MDDDNSTLLENNNSVSISVDGDSYITINAKSESNNLIGDMKKSATTSKKGTRPTKRSAV